MFGTVPASPSLGGASWDDAASALIHWQFLSDPNVAADMTSTHPPAAPPALNDRSPAIFGPYSAQNQSFGQYSDHASHSQLPSLSSLFCENTLGDNGTPANYFAASPSIPLGQIMPLRASPAQPQQQLGHAPPPRLPSLFHSVTPTRSLGDRTILPPAMLPPAFAAPSAPTTEPRHPDASVTPIAAAKSSSSSSAPSVARTAVKPTPKVTAAGARYPFASEHSCCAACALRNCAACRAQGRPCHLSDDGSGRLRAVCTRCMSQHRTVHVSADRVLLARDVIFLDSAVAVPELLIDDDIAQEPEVSADADDDTESARKGRKVSVVPRHVAVTDQAPVTPMSMSALLSQRQASNPHPFVRFYADLNGCARHFEIFDANSTSLWASSLEYSHLYVFPTASIAQAALDLLPDALFPLSALDTSSSVWFSICSQCVAYQVSYPQDRAASQEHINSMSVPTSGRAPPPLIPNFYSRSLCRKFNSCHLKKQRVPRMASALATQPDSIDRSTLAMFASMATSTPQEPQTAESKKKVGRKKKVEEQDSVSSKRSRTDSQTSQPRSDVVDSTDMSVVHATPLSQSEADAMWSPLMSLMNTQPMSVLSASSGPAMPSSALTTSSCSDVHESDAAAVGSSLVLEPSHASLDASALSLLARHRLSDFCQCLDGLGLDINADFSRYLAFKMLEALAVSMLVPRQGIAQSTASLADAMRAALGSQQAEYSELLQSLEICDSLLPHAQSPAAHLHPALFVLHRVVRLSLCSAGSVHRNQLCDFIDEIDALLECTAASPLTSSLKQCLTFARVLALTWLGRIDSAATDQAVHSAMSQDGDGVTVPLLNVPPKHELDCRQWPLLAAAVMPMLQSALGAVDRHLKCEPFNAPLPFGTGMQAVLPAVDSTSVQLGSADIGHSMGDDRAMCIAVSELCVTTALRRAEPEDAVTFRAQHLGTFLARHVGLTAQNASTPATLASPHRPCDPLETVQMALCVAQQCQDVVAVCACVDALVSLLLYYTPRYLMSTVDAWSQAFQLLVSVERECHRVLPLISAAARECCGGGDDDDFSLQHTVLLRSLSHAQRARQQMTSLCALPPVQQLLDIPFFVGALIDDVVRVDLSSSTLYLRSQAGSMCWSPDSVHWHALDESVMDNEVVRRMFLHALSASRATFDAVRQRVRSVA